MVTFSWMVEQLRHHLSFEPSLNTLLVWDRFQLIRPIINDVLKNDNAHWLTKEVKARLAKEPKNDLWNDGNKTRSLNIAADVLKGWAIGPIVDSFEGEMKDAGTLTRTPGNYRDRSPGQSRAFRLGATNEQIHPTVAYRMEKLGSKYMPEALAGFKRQMKKDNNGKIAYEWVKENIRIPEYKIAPELPDKNLVSGVDEKTGPVKGDDRLDQFERLLISGDSSAIAFIGHVDKEYGLDSWAARSLDPQLKAAPVEHENVGFQPNNSF